CCSCCSAMARGCSSAARARAVTGWRIDETPRIACYVGQLQGRGSSGTRRPYLGLRGIIANHSVKITTQKCEIGRNADEDF
ncbi:hypothetical protein, partial [Ralstonia pseudosolanacearum]|uniref:hypothetical protein n=1 Tax=Ralstonia pseudosolanacearum TaxID=1310165 RepID=UPI001FFBB337